jgi:hypothetical protein
VFHKNILYSFLTLSDKFPNFGIKDIIQILLSRVKTFSIIILSTQTFFDKFVKLSSDGVEFAIKYISFLSLSKEAVCKFTKTGKSSIIILSSKF